MRWLVDFWHGNPWGMGFCLFCLFWFLAIWLTDAPRGRRRKDYGPW